MSGLSRRPFTIQTPNDESGSGLKFLQDLQGSFGMAVSFSIGGKKSMPQNAG